METEKDKWFPYVFQHAITLEMQRFPLFSEQAPAALKQQYSSILQASLAVRIHVMNLDSPSE